MAILLSASNHARTRLYSEAHSNSARLVGRPKCATRIRCGDLHLRAMRRWGHPSMLDGALQTLNVNGWVAPLVPAKWTRFKLTLGCARRDYHHVILSRRTNQLQSIPWKRSGIGMILFGSHTPPCRMPHQSIRCNTPSRIRLVQCPHCFGPTVEVARR